MFSTPVRRAQELSESLPWRQTKPPVTLVSPQAGNPVYTLPHNKNLGLWQREQRLLRRSRSALFGESSHADQDNGHIVLSLPLDRFRHELVG
jgi:hypothetical protein